MPRLRVSAAARVDIRDASLWYGDTSEELERRFLAEVARILGRLATSPKQFRLVSHGLRSARLNDFPYNVLFRHRGDVVTVIACFHTSPSRDPAIWQGRL